MFKRGCSSRFGAHSTCRKSCSPVRGSRFPWSRSWCADSLPAAPDRHIAGLRQGPVQRAVAPRLRTQSPPLLLLPIHFMDHESQSRRYLAPLSGQHPRFLLYPAARNSAQPLLGCWSSPKLKLDRVACGIRSRPSTRFSASSWPSRLLLQPAPATDHAVDQGQDMILPVPLQRCSTRTPVIARATPSRSISWRTSTKPEQFSSGAPWCSSTTTRGFCTVPLVDKSLVANLELHPPPSCPTGLS